MPEHLRGFTTRRYKNPRYLYANAVPSPDLVPEIITGQALGEFVR